MNLGKFQKLIEEKLFYQCRYDPSEMKGILYSLLPTIKCVIEELERALDVKNEAEEIRGEGRIPTPEFLDAVKRYRDYGIE